MTSCRVVPFPTYSFLSHQKIKEKAGILYGWVISSVDVIHKWQIDDKVFTRTFKLYSPKWRQKNFLFHVPLGCFFSNPRENPYDSKKKRLKGIHLFLFDPCARNKFALPSLCSFVLSWGGEHVAPLFKDLSFFPHFFVVWFWDEFKNFLALLSKSHGHLLFCFPKKSS